MPFFLENTLNKFELLGAAGEALSIGQVSGLNGVSHYPVFQRMHIVSQPIEIVPTETEPYVFVRIANEELSNQIPDPMLKGRRLFLGKGRTVAELLQDIGIGDLANIRITDAQRQLTKDCL